MQRIEDANEIIDDYATQGLRLTLRQLYYRFVAADKIPNNFRSYKNLQGLINDARLAGLIDWDAIEDRTRNLKSPPSWDSPEDVIAAAANSYRADLWEDQTYHVEVWVEKDALLGVVQKACEAYRLPYFSCRGYTSQSEVWTAAMRLKRMYRPCVVLHLGDHDPSGVDMTRDIEDRFHLFGADNVEVRRLALNMDQIRQYNPPPNPVKPTDVRTSGYAAKFGESCWELDALEPKTLINLIHSETQGLIDFVAWNAMFERERKDRSILLDISNFYPDVAKFVATTKAEEEED